MLQGDLDRDPVLFAFTVDHARIEGGLAAVGIGLALLTGSWIPLAVAAVVGAVVAIIGKGDELKKKLEGWQDSLSEYVGNGTLEWQDFAYYAVAAINGIISAVETVIGWVQTLCGWIKTAAQWLADLAGWSVSFNGIDMSGNGGGGTTLGGWKPTTRRATGGYVQAGELFVAREAGPELVGSMGGHTAVANNDQIVEGIKAGVFEAVSAAMGGGGGQTVRIYLDGKEIARSTTKYQNQMARANAY